MRKRVHTRSQSLCDRGSTTNVTGQPSCSFKSVIKSCFPIFVISCCIKILLINTTYSTDFEVHRHWMSLTWLKSATEWYYDNTSQWTLDYPPLFAWFEWLIGAFASLITPESLILSSTPIHSHKLTLFHRGTVIVTDIILFLGVCWYCTTSPYENTVEYRSRMRKSQIMTSLICFHPGLLLVDHMHFQYNGMLLGILLLIFCACREAGNVHSSKLPWLCLTTVLTAGLLCMKHIFIFTVPIIGIIVLRLALSDAPTSILCQTWYISRIIACGCFVIFVCFVSILWKDPFGQTRQMFSHLFPWHRGLTHAYWAPNIWALYNTADRILVQSFRGISVVTKGYVNLESVIDPIAANSGLASGLVQDLGQHSHAVLTSIRPWMTHILCFVSCLPGLASVIIVRKAPHALVACATVCCALSYFLFGWHVHEKASLYAVIPALLSVCDSAAEATFALRLSFISTSCLFPLIQAPDEQLIPVVLSATYHYVAFICLDAFHRDVQQKELHTKVIGLQSVFHIYEGSEYLHKASGSADPYKILREVVSSICVRIAYSRIAFFGIISVHILQYVWRIWWTDFMPFLPLMLLSTVLAIGMVCVWIESVLLLIRKTKRVAYQYLSHPLEVTPKPHKFSHTKSN